LSEAFGVEPAAVERWEQALNAKVKESTESMAATGVSPIALQLGLGFGPAVRLRPILIGAGLGMVVVVGWHFLHGGHAQSAGYWLVTGIAAFTISGSASQIYESWRKTTHEQGLLKLTPSWPQELRVKILFLRCMGSAQCGGWIGWIAVSLFALMLRDVSIALAAVAAAVLLATSCGCSAILCALLARSFLKEWHLATVAVALSSVIGAVVLVVAGATASYWTLIALLLILAPAAISIATMLRRPLHFPVVPALDKP
jgi:hypothetical protein